MFQRGSRVWKQTSSAILMGVVLTETRTLDGRAVVLCEGSGKMIWMSDPSHLRFIDDEVPVLLERSA